MFKEQLIKISSQCVNFNKQKNDAETLTNTSNKRSGQVNYRSTAAGQKILLIAIQYGYSPLDKEKHKIRSIFSSNRAHPFGRCKFIFLHNDKCDFITVSTECSQKVPCPKNMIKFTFGRKKTSLKPENSSSKQNGHLAAAISLRSKHIPNYQHALRP